MAEELDGAPSTSPGSHREKYPWSDWTNGKWWAVEQGEDYDTTLETFRITLHGKAKTLDMKVVTRRMEDGKLAFCFSGKD